MKNIVNHTKDLSTDAQISNETGQLTNNLTKELRKPRLTIDVSIFKIYAVF